MHGFDESHDLCARRATGTVPRFSRRLAPRIVFSSTFFGLAALSARECAFSHWSRSAQQPARSDQLNDCIAARRERPLMADKCPRHRRSIAAAPQQCIDSARPTIGHRSQALTSRRRLQRCPGCSPIAAREQSGGTGPEWVAGLNWSEWWF